MSDDPGWDLSAKAVLRSFMPFRSARQADEAGASALSVTRQIFVSFCLGIAGVTAVRTIIGTVDDGDPPVVMSIALVIATGLVSVIAGHVMRRELDCSSDESLVTTYRTRFFLRIALAEAATLMAFAVSIALGPWWVYFLGLPFTVVGFVRAAPTSTHLRREDSELFDAGCNRSLSDLLSSTR